MIVFSEIEKNPGPEDHIFNPGVKKLGPEDQVFKFQINWPARL
jgi:hypothetical protein